MPCLVLLDGFGEEERAPVRQAADDATMSEDEGAGCMGDSREGIVLVGKERQLRWRIGGGKALFDFVRGMRFTHTDLVELVLMFWNFHREHTTAIISYNISPSPYHHRSQAYYIGLSSASVKAFALQG